MVAQKTAKANCKMSEEQFFAQAITTLRNGKSKGIHVRFSGFNDAYRKYFGTDSRAAQERLIKAGKITMRPCKGGVMLYLAGEQPVAVESGSAALTKMGIS